MTRSDLRARTGARLLAVALASGTVLAAAGTGTAVAAPALPPLLKATGSGSALKITLNLPAGVSLPGLGSTITHEIALTDGSISTVGSAEALTSALLGKGSTPLLADLLKDSTRADMSAPSARSESPVAVDANGVQLSLLPLVSTVKDPVRTVDGVLATSTSGIARLALTGDLLPAQLDAVTAPVVEVLAPALATLEGTATTATTTVAETVGTAIDTLNGALAPTPVGSTTQPLTETAKAAVTETVAALNETLASLTDTLAGLDDVTTLVALDAVSSDQTITRKGAAVTSTVENAVGTLDVLGGLVTIKGIRSVTSATAGGAPGSAGAEHLPAVLDLQVAKGALGFLVDSKGATLTGIDAVALPAELKSVVDGALDSVNDLLSQVAGVSVAPAEVVKEVAADGSSAAITSSGPVLTVDPPALAPLMGGKTFLTVALVPAQATAQSRLVAAAAAPPVALPQALPRTGGDLPLTGAVAAALVGLALVVRRRRAAATV